MIIEAPNSGHEQATVQALENFARHFNLRQSQALIGFENGTQQEIALLFDPKKLSAEHDPRGAVTPTATEPAPRFDAAFQLDLDVDDNPDSVHFSKPPLEVALTTQTGTALRLIGVHAKSKAPHGAKSKRDEVRISIANRRKQLAQCIWIRQRVDAHLAAGDHTIVLGDFNDGPGLDVYEKLFGRSGIEIVLGDTEDTDQTLYDPHAELALSQRIGASPTTARFYNHRSKTFLNALLDYIMVSQSVRDAFKPDWHIWHPFDDPKCLNTPKLSKALLTASDHFPVSVDLQLD